MDERDLGIGILYVRNYHGAIMLEKEDVLCLVRFVSHASNNNTSRSNSSSNRGTSSSSSSSSSSSLKVCSSRSISILLKLLMTSNQQHLARNSNDQSVSMLLQSECMKIPIDIAISTNFDILFPQASIKQSWKFSSEPTTTTRTTTMTNTTTPNEAMLSCVDPSFIIIPLAPSNTLFSEIWRRLKSNYVYDIKEKEEEEEEENVELQEQALLKKQIYLCQIISTSPQLILHFVHAILELNHTTR